MTRTPRSSPLLRRSDTSRGPRPTTLVLVAHGTSDPSGRQTVRDLRSQVAALLPDVRVIDAYVDVQDPQLSDVVKTLGRQEVRAVLVPVLLSTGYHMEVDVERAAEISPLIAAAPALGPHPVLADILLDRLDQAGAPPDAPVVLAAAGSSRPEAAVAVREVAAQLGAHRAGPVIAGFAAASTPSVREALVDQGRSGDDVWVASYLLGHGFFHTMLSKLGVPVTEPLGADPRIARLVAERFEAQLAVPIGLGLPARRHLITAITEARRASRRPA